LVDVQQWCRWYERRGAGRLRRILMREWDPIGVAGIPEARTEYDSYLGLIADRLRRDVSAVEIADLLHEIRCERMGLFADRATDLEVANAALAWHREEMARWEES
jgi:hypothetical protein